MFIEECETDDTCLYSSVIQKNYMQNDTSQGTESAPVRSALSGRGEIIADLVPDIIAEVNYEKVYTWLNKSGLDFFGEEAVGREASFYFEGDQQTYKDVNPVFEGMKDILYVESWQRRKDGQKRLLAWWCKSIKDENGKVIGVLSTAHDITERHNIEQRFLENEALLYNALSLAHLGPWVYDVVQDTFLFNDTFYAMLRTSADKVGGYTMRSMDYAKRFVHPDDAKLVGEEVKKAIEAEDPKYTRQLEHRIIFGDGTPGYIVVRFFVVKDDKGKTVKTIGINQDITDLKKNEEELRKAKDELQQKVHDLETFNNLAVNRELKMVELKGIIEELRKKLADTQT